MGKRELIIAAAFLVVGICVFQFAAPAPKTADTGFSFSKMIDAAKREIKGEESYVAPPRQLTFAAGADITEVRVEGVNSTIKVTGEDRPDIGVTLTVTSTGEDEAAALAVAAKVEMLEDRVGNTLTLRMKFPPEKRQTAAAVFLVPARLDVKLDAPRDPVVSNVKSLEFLNPARGATELTKIASVRGDQTSGQLTMTQVAEAKMLLTRVRARISDLKSGTFDVRDGETEISGAQGPLEIEERRGDVLIRNHKGAIKISGSDGQVRIEGGADDIRLDLRRAEVDAELTAGASGSIVTSDETLRVAVAEPGNFKIDAAATGGTIDAGAWNLTPTTSNGDARLDAAIGTKNPNAPRLSLRNSNGDIVIRKSSKK